MFFFSCLHIFIKSFQAFLEILCFFYVFVRKNVCRENNRTHNMCFVVQKGKLTIDKMKEEAASGKCFVLSKFRSTSSSLVCSFAAASTKARAFN